MLVLNYKILIITLCLVVGSMADPSAVSEDSAQSAPDVPLEPPVVTQAAPDSAVSSGSPDTATLPGTTGFRGIKANRTPLSARFTRGLDIALWPLRTSASGVLWGLGKVGATAGNPETIRMVKQFLYFYQKKAGWHPVVTYTSGYRPLAGATLFYKDDRFRSSVTGIYGGRDLYSGKLKLRLPGTVYGYHNAISFKGLFRQDDNIRFYGMGPTPNKPGGRNVRRADATSEYGVFTLKTGRLQVGFWQKTAGRLRFQSDIGLCRREFKNGGHGDPSLDDVFDINRPTYGFSNEAIQLVNSHLKAEYISSNPKNIHASGIQLSSYIGSSHGISSTRASFVNYGGLIAAHLPPIAKTRRFVLGFSADGIHNLHDTRNIPFTEYPKHHFFRGASHRKIIRTDNALVEYFLEYQWFVNHLMQGQLFVNGLSVGKDAGDIQWNKGLWAVGGGLVFHHQAVPLGTLFFAGGSEGFRFKLEFGIDKRQSKIQWLN